MELPEKNETHAFRVSRRAFILGLPGLALAIDKARKEYRRIGKLAEQQNRSWEAGSVPLETFFSKKENAEKLEGVSIGASFSPEVIEDMKGKGELLPDDDEVSAIRWAHDTLGIRSMRIGCRWDRCVKPGGEIDLSYYEKTLQTCFELGINVTLGLGIKVFRYPEDHIPEHVLQKYFPDGLPEGTIIAPGHPIATEAMDFMGKFMDALIDKHKENPQYLERIIAFNPENEALSPACGKHRLTISQNYLRQVMELLDKKLPGRRFVLNTFGTNRDNFDVFKGPTLAELANFIRKTADDPKHRQFAGRMVAGLDYYYDSPMGGVLQLAYNLLFSKHKPDTITILGILGGSGFIDDIMATLETAKSAVKIVEFQLEPWVTALGGNSLQAFLANLHRCINKFDQRPLELDAWGIEYLYAASRHPSRDQENILDAIAYVNHAKPAKLSPIT